MGDGCDHSAVVVVASFMLKFNFASLNPIKTQKCVLILSFCNFLLLDLACIDFTKYFPLP